MRYSATYNSEQAGSPHAAVSPAMQLGRLPLMTGRAKRRPERPAEVERLVSAVTECVVGGVWVGPRVLDPLGQLGDAALSRTALVVDAVGRGGPRPASLTAGHELVDIGGVSCIPPQQAMVSEPPEVGLS